MKNGWTGGQYSLYRICFGVYLFIHFFQLLPWGRELFSNEGMISDKFLSPLIKLFPSLLAINDSPLIIYGMLILSLVASIFFILGKWDRTAALFMWYTLACFLGRNPLISNPSLPFIGWLLLAHVFLPSGPYGSITARHRVDPRGTWAMPATVFLAAWIVMAIGYTYSGILKLQSPSWIDGSAFSYLLQNPLIRCNGFRAILMNFPTIILKMMTWGALFFEVAFVLLALFKKLRPWAWSSMLCMHLGLLCLVNFADLTWGMIIVHFFTFDPGWIKPRPLTHPLIVFYDGTCGLCHAFIRFIIAENKKTSSFQFAPLQGDLFREKLRLFSKVSVPDSVVVLNHDRILFKSDAVLKVMASLGGIWQVIAFLISVLPARFRDVIYDLVARIRHRLFSKPKDECPMIPIEMREYFKF